MNHVEHTIDPWFDKDSEVLLLGSMPSKKSRENLCYYAHPKNRFWKVLEILFEEKIENRKEFCKKHHIALWDTIKSCDIHASSDASIKKLIPNDISIILSHAPIKKVFTIGKKSHEVYQKYIYPKTKKEDICLPSTSPANASYSLEDLVKEFSILLEVLKN